VAAQGGSVLVIDSSFNGIFGDPCPDENKVLTIDYLANGAPGHCTTLEGSSVLIDARTYARARSSSSSLLRHRSVSSGSARALRDDPAEAAPAVVLRTPELVRKILGYLHIHPDRLQSARVSRVWRDVLVGDGLTDALVVGVRAFHGRPCYLDLPLSFFEMVLKRSVGHLQVLDLSYYEALTDDVLVPALEGNARSLRVLDLSGCTGLTSRALVAVGRSCLALQALSLKRLPSAVVDEAVVSVARNCPLLEELNLSDCVQVSDEGIREVGERLARLRVFHAKDLYRVTDESVRVLLATCGARLQVLSLWSMHRITGAALGPMAGGSLRKLASLNLWECFNLDDDAIIGTVCHCPNLVNLNLRNMHLLTDHAITHLAARLGRLEHLDLRYLHLISDESLLAIAQGLPHLRSLNLTHCSGITHVGLAAVCSELEQLTELWLAHGPDYDDDTVRLISDSMNRRRSRHALLDLLDLRGNPLVSAAALGMLTHTLGKRFNEGPQRLFLFAPTLQHHQHHAEYVGAAQAMVDATT
jgi:hypothetical protein